MAIIKLIEEIINQSIISVIVKAFDDILPLHLKVFRVGRDESMVVSVNLMCTNLGLS